MYAIVTETCILWRVLGMQFVPTDELKTGMRLAKPIYNRTGVMLYDRDTKLTSQGINSIKNFGLIGIYILEPAEPLPPLTDADREFERFQTVSVFKVKEILDDVRLGKNPIALPQFVAEIQKKYGRNKDRISFAQSLRSPEDNVFKHTLNVAILSAAITGKMTVTNEEQKNVITAAVLHDIGSLDIPPHIASKKTSELSDEDKKLISRCREEGYRIVRDTCDLDSDIMKNIMYLLRALKEMGEEPSDKDSQRPRDMSVEALKVAYMFDTLTAMKLGEEPYSDIAAYKFLKHPMNRMSANVVAALTYAINIVPPGCTVLFENGTKGIVVADNADDILRPFILSFKDNQIYNLADGKVYEEYQIKDVLKTLDNRYVMTGEYQKYLDQLSSGNEKTIAIGKR